MVLRGLLAIACLVCCAPLAASASNNYAVLYGFGGGTDGQYPVGPLLAGEHGTLYGVTFTGGVGCIRRHSQGCGAVYQIAPNGTKSVIYAFQGGADGESLNSGVIADAAGNLYGVTVAGGGSGCATTHGCGTVYKIAGDGTKTKLHAFHGNADGSYPTGNLIMDGAGTLYGVTTEGGLDDAQGFGTVFKITSDGTKSTLYVFQGQGDGGYPYGPLAIDGAGNLFGATLSGGTGEGVVFKLTPDGTQSVLHAFGGTGDASDPETGVVIDAAGNLYGTSYGGGAFNRGAVYKVAPDGGESVLHSFSAGGGGYRPQAGVILDGDGDLFGTDNIGGNGKCGGHGCGTVFKLAPDGTETVLHVFRKKYGDLPAAGLATDSHGNIFGTTEKGGASDWGVVFRIRP